ncbi:MAG: formylglycine-generating enzyme family protein [Rhodospirillaceae bacterium]|nr:formylglycine-generating enzyme family protein [Rhodospirillaceae bacterium]
MIRTVVLAGVVALCGIAAQAAEDEPVKLNPAVRALKDCPTCPDMMVLPPGTFTMGTAAGSEEFDEETGETLQLAVTIEKPFALGKTEVTVSQFEEFVRDSGYKPEPGCRLWDNRWINDPKGDFRGGGAFKTPKGNFPVVCVGWTDAKAYAAWLGKKTGKTYRLPSESEWEYAARAGTTTPRYFGMNSFEGVSISLACDHGNVYDVSSQAKYPFPYPYARCTDKSEDLAAVGSYKANAFGLHDMIGNVWEWVEDCYTASYWGRPPNGKAWVWQGGCETRGLRGGSWTSRPADARSAKRQRAPAAAHTTYMGFRIARDVSEGEAK